MGEGLSLFSEVEKYTEKKRYIMEHESGSAHLDKVKQAEHEPRPSTPEHKESPESVPEKGESASNVETGRPVFRKPEHGLELLLWNLAEKIVSIEIKREALSKELLKKIKDTERLKLILLIIESQIRRLAKAVYVPLFRAMLRNYRDSFDALVQGNYSTLSSSSRGKTSSESSAEHH